jgi:dTDP-4-dehydrorhamnose reductase
MSSSRILVTGANGMLGHEAIRLLAREFEVWGTCRNPGALPDLGVPAGRILGGLDAARPDSAYGLIDQVQPDLVLNAVGIVKQRAEASSAVQSIAVNSLWPHVLAEACERRGARVVHVSTDCVFSGSRGLYTEADVPDAFDLYGRSKLLGEVTDRQNVITLRASMIGWQLGEPTGLVGWFAAHRGEPLKGFRGAVFSGLTTHALVGVIRDVVIPDGRLSGLWHVSAEPIDKYSLLSKLAGFLGWEVDLEPVDEPVIDRSLNSARLREHSGWTPPSWEEMLFELAMEYRVGHPGAT